MRPAQPALRVPNGDPFRMSVGVLVYDDTTRTKAYDSIAKHDYGAIALVTPRFRLALHFFGDLEPTDVGASTRRGRWYDRDGKRQPHRREDNSPTP